MEELELLETGKSLNNDQAEYVFREIIFDNFTPELARRFLLASKSPTALELAAYLKVLLSEASIIKLEANQLIDVCGTGGDGKNTFNISTLTALTLAVKGIKVAKHGNNAFSSKVGSSNILNALGINFTACQDQLNECLAATNICFLHAPLFHPKLATIAAVRKELGSRTVFNLLGPLANPANITHQLTGVASQEVFELYKDVLMNQNSKNFLIVHSVDGYDEISLTGNFITAGRQGVQQTEVKELEMDCLSADQLLGAETLELSVQQFVEISKGNGTDAQQKVVAVNAAYAEKLIYPDRNLQGLIAQNLELLKSSQIFDLINKLRFQTKY